MRETKVYSRLRLHLSDWGECDRLENAVGSGMSDVFYNIHGRTGWIETKVAKKGVIYFEKFQPNWIAKHARLGARMFVVVMDEQGGLYFYKGKDIVAAPKEPYKKWIIVKMTDVLPTIYMPAPHREWGRVRELLIS